RLIIRNTVMAAAILAAVGPMRALAQNFNEVEPNQTKAAATPIVFTTTPIGNGQVGTITGHSTGTSTTATGDATADTYLITLPADAPGIYRYELTLSSTTSPTSFVTTLRGLSQSSGTIGSTDTAIQANPNNQSLVNAFYSFGSASQVYYRVTGAAAS